MSFEKILFYGIIIVGALLLIGLTYYRIYWAQRRAMRKLSKKKRK